MLTMKDIAAEVGVSVSSVSLVLSGNGAGRVNAQVAERIRAVADELGYVPNQLARSLKTKQTDTIGILADRVATVPFSGQMIAGAQRAARSDQFMLLMMDTDGDAAAAAPAVRDLLQRNITAMIIASTFHTVVEMPAIPSTMPLVLLDAVPPAGVDRPVDYTVPDEENGAYMVTSLLIEAGHTRVGFIDVPQFPIASRLRGRGYERALADGGLPFDPSLVARAVDPSTASAGEPIRRLLALEDRPTAVFCFSDQLAMGVYNTAARMGLSIPDDLSVAGFDNQAFVAEALEPSLTTVQLPHRKMGEWAVRRAVLRVRDGYRDLPPEGYLMPCPPVVRESIAPPPTN